MSIDRWRIEIIKASPTPLDMTASDPVDVTSHVQIDGWGSISRAVERDLLSFRTGDLTLTFDNPDGYFDDLFSDLDPDERWTLCVRRNAVLLFQGVILGMGSITFDRKSDICELTAYGPTRILLDASAEGVTRTFGALTVTTATSGASTLTMNDTTGLLTADVLHLTDHVNSEDVTVKQVTSGTVVSLDAVLVNTYASGSEITMETPFHRYKSIDFLVRALLEEAGIPVAEVLLDGSQFNTLAPTGVNLEGLNLATQDFRRGMAEKNGVIYSTIADGAGSGTTYKQDSPDAAWDTVDAVGRGYIDWSKYFPQGTAEPSPVVRSLTVSETGVGASRNVEWVTGIDYDAATGVGAETTMYVINADLLSAGRNFVTDSVTSDGDTWVAGAGPWTLPGGNGVVHTTNYDRTVEFDKGRGVVLAGWKDTDGNNYFYQLAPGTGTWTNAKQGDDAASNGYFGMCYVADLDYVLALRVDGNPLGPSFEICAFRGTTRLWKRSFPNCLVRQESSLDGEVPPIWPTRSLRYVNGSMYCVLVSDGEMQLLRTDDEFQTYVMRSLFPATTITLSAACRIGSNYRVNVYDSSEPRGYLIAAPFYAGIIDYADFEGASVADALAQLATVSNAVFWVDDHLQGHFVARDLIPVGVQPEIDDLVMERNDQIHWEETKQAVTVSGGGITATAGTVGANSESLSVSSDFIPNEAFGFALAEALVEFYSKARKPTDLLLLNDDGHIYNPMDRVSLDGLRWIVHKSDHDPVSDEVRVTLLEDVENP